MTCGVKQYAGSADEVDATIDSFAGIGADDIVIIPVTEERVELFTVGTRRCPNQAISRCLRNVELGGGFGHVLGLGKESSVAIRLGFTDCHCLYSESVPIMWTRCASH
jgi:hypothetical protein